MLVEQMAKRDKNRNPNAEGPKESSVLEKLDAAESASVLKALVDHHPELRTEAEALAREALGEVSLFGSIAECVGKGAAIARLVVQWRQQGKNVSWNLGALPPNPRNFALSGQNSCWAWTTREAL